ncbi:MAG: aldo/keto reductase [Planctomycetaceae bacterium]|nr:aldo/keto reductase [Planctomycetaceae bacterium]
MQYRQMGKWGVKLSVVGLGSYLTIGMKLDEKQSRATVKAAFDLGINFIDTANAYNTGAAETMLGKVLKDYKRSDLFVLTKVFAPMGSGPNDQGLCAKHVYEQCHASLERLQMDYVDLLMCHRPDPSTPLEETVRTMEDLSRQGKILYWGTSEWPAELMVKGNAVAKEIGARGIGVNEPRYSMLYRHPEASVFPTCGQEGIGNVIFSGLAHGMLTGKYKPGEEAPDGTRAASDDTNAVIKALYWTEENKKRSQEVVTMAGDLGTTPAALSLAWCLRKPEVTSTIIGATKVSQIEDNAQAADLDIPQDVLDRIEELFPAPPVPGL